jgi:hypothetical protein
VCICHGLVPESKLLGDLMAYGRRTEKANVIMENITRVREARRPTLPMVYHEILLSGRRSEVEAGFWYL